MEKNIKQEKSNCLRIVLYGPESTGKTTLAKALAEHYRSVWVPEFARDYLQQKWDKHRKRCTLVDLLKIAEGQMNLENKQLRKVNKILFCDTNILVTQVWSETHFEGYCDPKILRWANEFHYDYYFLTGIDIPWKKDDLRDCPDQRHEMFAYFKETLEHYKCDYTILEGTHEKRMEKAKAIIRDIQSPSL